MQILCSSFYAIQTLFLLLIQFLTMRILQHTAPAVPYGYVYIQRLILMLCIQFLMKNELCIFLIAKIKCQILCTCYAEIIDKLQLMLMRRYLLHGVRRCTPWIQKA